MANSSSRWGSDPNAVPVGQHLLGDRRVVDEGAGPRTAVADEEPIALLRDLDMLPRDLGVVLQREIVRVAPPDLERRFDDRHDVVTTRSVGVLEPGGGHLFCHHAGRALRSPSFIRKPVKS